MEEYQNGVLRMYYDNYDNYNDNYDNYNDTNNYTQTKLLYYEYFVFNGKKNGTYKAYYENGQLREICNYKDGKKEGGNIKYYNDGCIRIICNYKNDKLEGEYNKYYDGKLFQKSFYKNNKLEI